MNDLQGVVRREPDAEPQDHRAHCPLHGQVEVYAVADAHPGFGGHVDRQGTVAARVADRLRPKLEPFEAGKQLAFVRGARVARRNADGMSEDVGVDHWTAGDHVGVVPLALDLQLDWFARQRNHHLGTDQLRVGVRGDLVGVLVQRDGREDHRVLDGPSRVHDALGDCIGLGGDETGVHLQRGKHFEARDLDPKRAELGLEADASACSNGEHILFCQGGAGGGAKRGSTSVRALAQLRIAGRGRQCRDEDRLGEDQLVLPFGEAEREAVEVDVAREDHRVDRLGARVFDNQRAHHPPIAGEDRLAQRWHAVVRVAQPPSFEAVGGL